MQITKGEAMALVAYLDKTKPDEGFCWEASNFISHILSRWGLTVDECIRVDAEELTVDSEEINSGGTTFTDRLLREHEYVATMRTEPIPRDASWHEHVTAMRAARPTARGGRE
jgi:hypothetical protein